jgi:hypothetical protein
MQDNMLLSTEESHSLHDLTEFAFSKEVLKDHPRIISVYSKLLPVLYAFAHYQCVWPVIQVVEDSKLLCEMQLQYFQKIHKTKGLVNASKEK